jgi:uncharacterized membrane protein YbaN (DUF454 family)
LYIGLGFVCVGLAVLGAMLPVLPTTPFVLLAGYFFCRSSPRNYLWLQRSPWFGPLLRDWEHHRGVRRRVKWLAVGMIAFAMTASAASGQLSTAVLAVLMIAGGIGLTVVLRLPTIADNAPRCSD